MDPIDRLQGIAAFLPRFQVPGFEFGHWENGEQGEGTFTFGYMSYSDAANEFESVTYRLGWIRTGFDWGAWQETQEAKALRDDPLVLAKATPEQLANLLTICVRGERFCEGALRDTFESGLLTRILERAAVLAAEIETGADPGNWSWPTIEA